MRPGFESTKYETVIYGPRDGFSEEFIQFSNQHRRGAEVRKGQEIPSDPVPSAKFIIIHWDAPKWIEESYTKANLKPKVCRMSKPKKASATQG